MNKSSESQNDQPKQAGTIPSISVFFPCHNEDNSIEEVVGQALNVLRGLGTDFEIIIVDDGSTDRTGCLADMLVSQNENVKVIHHPINLGYGAALQSGFRAAG